jgi:hypothetical protein
MVGGVSILYDRDPFVEHSLSLYHDQSSFSHWPFFLRIRDYPKTTLIPGIKISDFAKKKKNYVRRNIIEVIKVFVIEKELPSLFLFFFFLKKMEIYVEFK